MQCSCGGYADRRETVDAEFLRCVSCGRVYIVKRKRESKREPADTPAAPKPAADTRPITTQGSLF